MQRNSSQLGVPVPLIDPLRKAASVEQVGVKEAALPDLGKEDPYEIAYLRGGRSEVLRLYLFDLIQRGYLRMVLVSGLFSDGRRLEIAPRAPSASELSGTHQAILGWFNTPMTTKQAFASHSREPLNWVCLRLHEQVREKGLLAPANRQWKLTGTVFLVAIPAVLIAGPVLGFIAGVAANLAAQRVFSRLSEAGKQRLATLEVMFREIRSRPRTARLNTADPALVMAVAVFGTVILAGSPYDAFAAAVDQAAGWSFGLGSGGGGCDAGDGDGCGGCGGCGCG